MTYAGVVLESGELLLGQLSGETPEAGGVVDMVGLDVHGVDGALDGDVPLRRVQDDDVLVRDGGGIAAANDGSGRVPAAELGGPSEGQGDERESDGKLHLEGL